MKCILFVDCDREEVQTFSEAISSVLKEDCTIKVARSDYGQKNKLINIFRYIKYFMAPLLFFLSREKCDLLLGWQQFYALNMAFYCRLFKVKKSTKIVALNFTYKRKKGFLGSIYYKYMKYCVDNIYLDFMHVPSYNYVESCSEELGVDKSKFIVRGFGVPDLFDNWKQSKVDCSDYSLTIGRSNRDFDFLVSVWGTPCLEKHRLVIISDTYMPKKELPKNVILRNDITGDEQFPWIANADLVIIPINDGTICSGDTVLLNSMMLKRTTIVTTPSTLQEMYIKDGYNGFAIAKDINLFAQQVCEFLSDDKRRNEIGENARKMYLENFSRYAMGRQIAEFLKKHLRY